MNLYDRLAELGLELPPVPHPAGAYVPAKVHGDLVFTAGQLPLVADGAAGPHVHGVPTGHR